MREPSLQAARSLAKWTMGGECIAVQLPQTTLAVDEDTSGN